MSRLLLVATLVQHVRRGQGSASVSTLVGSGSTDVFTDGIGTSASFKELFSATPSLDGAYLYVTDVHHCVKRVELNTSTVEPFVGLCGIQGEADGIGTNGRLWGPHGSALSPDGSTLALCGHGNRVRLIELETKTLTTLAGDGEHRYQTGNGVSASFRHPRDVTWSPDGRYVFVADRDQIRQIEVSTKKITFLAGCNSGCATGGTYGSADGVGAAVGFFDPHGLISNSNGTHLYIADTHNHRIRALTIATGAVSTFVGSSNGFSDGVGTAAQFALPRDVVLSADGSRLYVADDGNQRIREIDIATQNVVTLADQSQPQASSMANMKGLSIAPSGAVMYVAGVCCIYQLNLIGLLPPSHHSSMSVVTVTEGDSSWNAEAYSWTTECSDGTILSGGAPFTGTLDAAVGSSCTLTMSRTDGYSEGWYGALWSV